MSSVTDFISQYTASSRSAIDFAWNGKHAADFRDSNQEFRWQVVDRCINQSRLASPLLLEHLFLADAEWAAEAWGSPHHFAELGSALLEIGQEGVLDSFSRGFVRSFDTFGACHEIQLSGPLLARISASAKEALSMATEEDHQKRLEATLELFTNLENKTATQGWAKVETGTPVSSVHVTWPRWYHRLWKKISSIWSPQAARRR
jgi:hypothetical protein